MNKYKEYGKFEEIKNKSITTKAIFKKLEKYIGYFKCIELINDFCGCYNNGNFISVKIIGSNQSNNIGLEIYFFADETKTNKSNNAGELIYLQRDSYIDEHLLINEFHNVLFLSHSKEDIYYEI